MGQNKIEDIGPVEERKLYDGFLQWGDSIKQVAQKEQAKASDWIGAAAKTILGTNTDILTNLVSGVVGWGEDVVDAGASLAGMFTETFGWDSATQNIRDFVTKDLYDEQEITRNLFKTGALTNAFAATNPGLAVAIPTMFTIEEWLNPTKSVDDGFGGIENIKDDNSVLGETSKGILQSSGETLAKQGIQLTTGIPVGDIITGVTVFGSQAEQALKEDANFMQAGGSGLISAAAEIMFEKLSGGIKISGHTLDEGLTKLMSRSISNVALRNFLNFAKDMGGEALEEAATEFVGKLGTLLYKDRDQWDEILFSKDALVDYIQSAISGGLMGGAFNAANAVNSTKKGVDYKSGLTNDEQKVVDKVTENAIKQKETDGKKLSAKEKNLLYNDILKQLEDGDISITDIEDALGEEVFKDYADTIKYEEDILKQYEELGKKKNYTLTEASLFEELESQKKDIEQNSPREELKKQMSEKVFERVKDSKLMRSYANEARRGETFQADVNEYDEAERATIQSAIDAGFLNNTNKTRRFVNWVAKIAAKTGIKVDFTTNEKLKQSGFAIDGKTVNGYKTKDGIGINMQSKKILETVVGHEITHVFEGTELYAEMRKAVYAYAEAKGELKSRREAISKLYNGVTNDIDSELTAELVSEYLFTDQEFINRLANDNRNLFQKIWDEVKYMWKQAHPSSPEAQKLEKLKRAFEDAYKASGKQQKNTAESGVQYALMQFDDGRRFVSVETDQSMFDGLTLKEKTDFATNVIKERFQGKVIGIENRAFVNGVTANEYTHPVKHIDDNIYEAKMRASTELDNLMDAGFNFRNSPDGRDGHVHDDAVGGFDYFDVIFKVGDEYYQGVINVKVNNRGKLLKDITQIENITKDLTSRYGENPRYAFLRDVSMSIIPQKSDLSSGSSKNSTENDISVQGGTKLSISDSTGKELTKGQQEYFIDSKVRDKNGNLKVMYHGTNESFTTFDKSKAKSSGTYGKGFYFTDSDSHASTYGKTYEVYLNIKNPLQNGTNDITKDQLRKFVEALAENEDYGIENYGYDATVDSVTESVYGKSDFGMILDLNISCVGNMVEAIELFNEVNGTDYDGIIAPTETVAFYPNQIKSVRNKNPTTNDDMQFSLSEGTTEGEGTRAQDVMVEDVAPYDGYYDQSRMDSLLGNDSASEPNKRVQTVQDRLSEKIKNTKAELENDKRLRQESIDDYDFEIARLQSEYDAKKNKTTRAANDILRRIERLQRIKGNVDADYAKRISDLEKKVENMSKPEYRIAAQRMSKQEEYTTKMKELVGDTSTWTDKKLGIFYKTNTLRRNLRDIVRDANGNRDIAKADAIYEEIQGKYSHNEAILNKESNKIKKPYADMNITKAEDAYIQMLGELRYNPDTTLTEDVVNKYYEENKGKIDVEKVNKAIEMGRKTYDDLLVRVNKVLREQGMKEIPYRQGYFPHFTEDKQGILAKILNWKTQNTDIPTDIAGITEQFNPDRSWQSFNKQRTTDTTDYSFTKGLDSYVQGALDWIYHIEDIQKRRALENYIRYTHSDQGIKDKIDAIRKNETYDADEMQSQIDLVYKEAKNPLNNFVTDLRAGTNRLANKKSSLDRTVEEMTNRKIYSTMTNISNRVTGNMVAGSVSSALTNFIPITQSWGQVSPVSSLKAMGDTIKSIAKDDGTIAKSDFLTNRLNKAENLYKTTWDKVGDKLGFLMEGVDNFTAQTVWRSKYIENMSNGMSEAEAIKNADQFAANVMASRSRGETPTIFDSKNPLIKTLTAFQLEVNNQYGYMFKDMPQDIGTDAKGKLAKGYVAMFLGAYAYNALYSSLTGRDSAFDPVGIIMDLLNDLFGDDEEEPVDALMNFGENVVEELPFIGGLAGGGRIPISSALPYDGIGAAITGTIEDISEENWKSLTKEWLNPLYYLVMPMGGGQLKKSIEGLSMYSPDHPVAGSYTDSGKLRFPVEEDLASVAQAAVFGQWANKNAQKYLEDDIAPINESKIQEYVDSGLTVEEYWDYREGLKKFSTKEQKIKYIKGLDIEEWQKSVLISYLNKSNSSTSNKTISSSQYDKAMELLDDFNNRFGNN